MLHRRLAAGLPALVVADGPPQEVESRGIAQRIAAALCNPHSFRNYDFLKRRVIALPGYLPGEKPELASWAKFRTALLAEFGRRRWPFYVAEITDDSFRLEYWQAPRATMAPHYGGWVRACSADEWRAVAGLAREAARLAEVRLVEWSEDHPDWFLLEVEAPELSPERVRELRQDTMDRFSAIYRTVWPEGWLDRVVGPDVRPEPEPPAFRHEGE